MKLAIISDIHGNYPALLAVLKDATENNVDNFIFAGDYIFDLPYPNEVTDLIRNLKNAYVIKGNKESYLKKLLTEDQNNWNYDQMGAVYQTYRELKSENFLYLTNLNEYSYVSLPFHGKIYVTHYIKDIFGEQKKTDCSSSRFKKYMKKKPFTHEQFLDYVNHILKDEKIQDIISEIDATVIVCGHSHLQWHAYCGSKLIINPGSCGQPLDSNVMASYSILEDTALGLNVEEKRVCYDIEQTIHFAKTTEIYKKGSNWGKLVFLAMRTGEDNFSEFFQLAENIAKDKNESGYLFSNDTWNYAGNIYFRKVDI